MQDWAQWPDADITLLKSMYRDGFPTKDILAELPGHSRSTMFRLIKHLGLKRGPESKKAKRDAGIIAYKRANRDASTRDIAVAIGGVSSATVWAVLDGAGLIGPTPVKAKKKTTPAPKTKPKDKSKPKPPSSVAVGPLGHEPFRFPNGEYVTLETVSGNMCRWPVGDPGGSGFYFCGKPQRPGKSYCEECCKKAFVPLNPAAKASNKETVAAMEIVSGIRRAFG